jgi:hypothetical protein
MMNAPSFWPFFPICQRILWPGLGAVKLESLPLKTFWIKVFQCFSKQARGVLPGSWKLASQSKKGSKGKLIALRVVFSFYPSVPR